MEDNHNRQPPTEPPMEEVDDDIAFVVIDGMIYTVPAQAAHPRLPETWEDIRIKVQRSHYPLFLVIASLACLITSFLGIYLGLYGAALALKHRLLNASDLYKAIETEYDTKNMLQERLEKLQSYSLGWYFRETHNECLARAITYGDAQYLDLPYEKYLDILNGTIGWAEDTCSKLIFTPQTTMPSLRLVLRHSARTMSDNTMRAYQWAKKAAIDSVGWITRWVGTRILCKKFVEQDEFLKEVEPPEERKDLAPLQLQSKLDDILLDDMRRREFERAERLRQEALSLQLPPNYALDCSDGLVCRLSYKSNPSTTPALTPIKKANEVCRSLARLCSYIKHLNKVWFWVKAILRWSLSLQLTAGLAMVCFCFILLPRDLENPDQVQRTAVWLVCQCFLLVIVPTPSRLEMHTLSTDLEIVLAFVAGTAGICTVVAFFIPCENCQESISNLAWAVKELVKIWTEGVDIAICGLWQGLLSATKGFMPATQKWFSRRKPNEVLPNERNVANEETAFGLPDTPTRRSRSAEAPLRISCETSLFEDIQQELHRQRTGEELPETERAALRSFQQEQVDQAEDTESDSDSDCDSDTGMDDNESRLELEADEIPSLPSSSDSGSDWSVVDSTRHQRLTVEE